MAADRLAQSGRGLRVALLGKGGVGKSVVAGTMARLLARRGRRVLALDSDTMPGLAFSLGAEEPAEPTLGAAVEKDDRGRWRLRKGIGPVRAVRRYATPAADGVRLLQCGKLGGVEAPAMMGAANGFYRVVERLPQASALAGWDLVGDLPAGPRQAAFGWARYADTFIVLVEPTWQSALTARRSAGIVRAGGATVAMVANKVAGDDGRARIEQILGESVIDCIPRDPCVGAAERLGVPLLDHAPAARTVGVVDELVERLLSTLRPPDGDGTLQPMAKKVSPR